VPKGAHLFEICQLFDEVGRGLCIIGDRCNEVKAAPCEVSDDYGEQHQPNHCEGLLNGVSILDSLVPVQSADCDFNNLVESLLIDQV